MRITLSSFWKSGLFFALWLTFFLYGLQETEKLTGIPANRIQHLWICAGAILWVIAVYHLYCLVSKPINWLAVVLFRLIIWPVLMWKSTRNKAFTAVIVFVLIVPFLLTGITFVDEHFIFTNGIQRRLVSGIVWYFLACIAANAAVINIDSVGFLELPKISDFDGGKDGY